MVGGMEIKFMFKGRHNNRIIVSQWRPSSLAPQSWHLSSFKSWWDCERDLWSWGHPSYPYSLSKDRRCLHSPSCWPGLCFPHPSTNQSFFRSLECWGGLMIILNHEFYGSCGHVGRTLPHVHLVNCSQKCRRNLLDCSCWINCIFSMAIWSHWILCQYLAGFP